MRTSSPVNCATLQAPVSKEFDEELVLFSSELSAQLNSVKSPKYPQISSAMMTLMPYLESGSAIPSSTASRLDLDDDQLVDSHRQQVLLSSF